MFINRDWSYTDQVNVEVMSVIYNYYLSIFQTDVHGYRLVLQGLDCSGDCQPFIIITCLFFSLMFRAIDWSCRDWISVKILLCGDYVSHL